MAVLDRVSHPGGVKFVGSSGRALLFRSMPSSLTSAKGEVI